MDQNLQKRISKVMSLLLRHQPEMAGLSLDEAGWIDVTELLEGMGRLKQFVTRDQLETVVRDNDKQRFQFNEAGSRIRATQGHSLDVSLGYSPAAPPEFLFHGTARQFVASIAVQGLTKQRRHHVHLHRDATVAAKVGQRRGKAALFTVSSGQMHVAGFEFFVTPNQVWLTDAVPREFLQFFGGMDVTCC